MLRAAIKLQVCDPKGTRGPDPEAHFDATPRSAIGAAISILGGVTVGLIALSAALDSLPSASASPALRAAPFVLFFVFFAALLSGPVRDRARGVRARPRPEPDAVRVEITDVDIHFRTGRRDVGLAWADVTGFGETKHAFVLYAWSGLIHVIPKSAFLTLGDVNALRTAVRNRVATGAGAPEVRLDRQGSRSGSPIA
jgi:hypothetical protein